MELLAIEWAKALNIIGFSFLMVFALLLLIVIVLQILGKVITSFDKTPQAQIKTDSSINSEINAEGNQIPEDDIAAISMALYSYFNDTHDTESNVLTINKVSKRYSPWSSKIYGLNTYTK
jgi:glutaconyl-CoA/methylmalonyl-CoA decarboxylase subunit delta